MEWTAWDETWIQDAGLTGVQMFKVRDLCETVRQCDAIADAGLYELALERATAVIDAIVEPESIAAPVAAFEKLQSLAPRCMAAISADHRLLAEIRGQWQEAVQEFLVAVSEARKTN